MSSQQCNQDVLQFLPPHDSGELFISHSPPEFPFPCLLFSPFSELVLSSSMCQCAVTLSQRAVVFGAIKWTCVAWAAQKRCPHTLWPGQTLDIWYVLLTLKSFSFLLDLWPLLSQKLTKHSCVFDFNYQVSVFFVRLLYPLGTFVSKLKYESLVAIYPKIYSFYVTPIAPKRWNPTQYQCKY